MPLAGSSSILQARRLRGRTGGQWLEALLEDAGLKEVVGSAYRVDIALEAIGRFERYGCRGITKVLLKTLSVLLKDRSSRAFLKDVTGSLPKDWLGDMGYGVYAGRKELLYGARL